MKKIPHGATHACTMLIALSALASPACAEPLLSSVFSDHMVVQRDAPIAVWGDADPGSRVTVKFGKRSKAVDANAEGDWRAEFPAMKAGGPYVLSATAGGASETVGDVMIGDVYLCAGQSNMEFPVSLALNPQTFRADARFTVKDGIVLPDDSAALSLSLADELAEIRNLTEARRRD